MNILLIKLIIGGKKMKKIFGILILIALIGIVSISGCTSSDNNSSSYNSDSINGSTPVKNTTSSPATSSVASNSASSSSSSGSSSSKSSSSSSSSDTSGYFVGSVNSDVYHYSSCSAAKRIKSGNLITFNSVQQAKNAGYRPCKICNPPG